MPVHGGRSGWSHGLVRNEIENEHAEISSAVIQYIKRGILDSVNKLLAEMDTNCKRWTVNGYKNEQYNFWYLQLLHKQIMELGYLQLSHVLPGNLSNIFLSQWPRVKIFT